MREVWFAGKERAEEEEEGLEENRGRTWNQPDPESARGDLLPGSKVRGLMNDFTVTVWVMCECFHRRNIWARREKCRHTCGLLICPRWNLCSAPHNVPRAEATVWSFIILMRCKGRPGQWLRAGPHVDDTRHIVSFYTQNSLLFPIPCSHRNDASTCLSITTSALKVSVWDRIVRSKKSVAHCHTLKVLWTLRKAPEHWWYRRVYFSVVAELLIKEPCLLFVSSLQDNEGQTALHYGKKISIFTL